MATDAYGLQLTGVMTLGGTDYSDELFKFVLMPNAETVDVPGTYADATVGTRKGGMRWTAEIHMTSNPDDAAGVWEEVYQALISDEGELAFTARWGPGAISATNPEYSGTLIVTNLQVGHAVNEGRGQTITVPLKAGVTRAVA